MKTFYFQFKCLPQRGHENFVQYSGAHATVFITGEDPILEKERAWKYVESYGWQIQETDDARLIHKEACDYDPSVASQFANAQLYGISCLFVSYTGGGLQFN